MAVSVSSHILGPKPGRFRSAPLQDLVDMRTNQPNFDQIWPDLDRHWLDFQRIGPDSARRAISFSAPLSALCDNRPFRGRQHRKSSDLPCARDAQVSLLTHAFARARGRRRLTRVLRQATFRTEMSRQCPALRRTVGLPFRTECPRPHAERPCLCPIREVINSGSSGMDHSSL